MFLVFNKLCHKYLYGGWHKRKFHYFSEKLLTVSLGSNIKNIRELRNYTQSYVATELGISVPGYSKIENDKTDLTITRLKSIAKILNTDMETILNFDPRNVFRNYDNNKSMTTGYHAQHNTHVSVDRILANMQSQIDELKKQNG